MYAVGFEYGLKVKSGFYLSIIYFSIIIIISAFLFNIAEGEIMFLFISLFIIVSVTYAILNLIKLQKEWKN
jgi:c-di-AMP phosphodiesterase-like protein